MPFMRVDGLDMFTRRQHRRRRQQQALPRATRVARHTPPQVNKIPRGRHLRRAYGCYAVRQKVVLAAPSAAQS